MAMLQKNTKTIVIFSLFLFILGLSTGALGHHLFINSETAETQERYNYLSKRIMIDNPNDVILEFITLEKDLAKYIDQNIGKDSISLYFEYLPTGSSVGINENTELIGASLLKLPVAINAYKLAEQGKLSLDKIVSLKKEWLNDGYGDLYKKGVGYNISIRDAIKYALEYSDNTAILLLYEEASRAQGTSSLDVLGFIDVNYETTEAQQVLIGAQAYSSILKCLYFSCYLNKDNSQEVLSYLARSSATTRLKKYMPDSLLVAHKIGTYGDEIQSDCGIFYLDKRNYLLCVMTKGADPIASEHIAKISQIVYGHMKPEQEEK